MSIIGSHRRGPWAVYGKSIAAALVLVATAVQAALSDSATGGRLTQVESVQIAIAFVNACLIYLVPNVPQWPLTKSILAAGLAALQLATSLIIDGISSADMSALVIAALMVLAPAVTPSRSIPDGPPPVQPADAEPPDESGPTVYGGRG